jgi:hypothetical protein
MLFIGKTVKCVLDNNWEYFRQLISGYGDTYDDEDDEEHYDDSLEDVPTEVKKDDDDNNNIYKDMTKSRFVFLLTFSWNKKKMIGKILRKTRAISGVTMQGVPILEEPYVSRKNRTRTASGVILLNERDETNPRLKLTWDNSRRNVNSPRRYKKTIYDYCFPPT